MRLNSLYPFPEERKTRKRVGRGSGSGLGCTAGKGNKGQNARAGGGVPAGFEGGQMPLYRRVPKKGFTNIFRTEYATVNVGQLEIFDNGATVTVETLKEAGLVKKTLAGVKILGNGDLTKKITVEAAKFSQVAKEKIEALGGKAEVK